MIQKYICTKMSFNSEIIGFLKTYLSCALLFNVSDKNRLFKLIGPTDYKAVYIIIFIIHFCFFKLCIRLKNTHVNIFGCKWKRIWSIANESLQTTIKDAVT